MIMCRPLQVANRAVRHGERRCGFSSEYLLRAHERGRPVQMRCFFKGRLCRTRQQTERLRNAIRPSDGENGDRRRGDAYRDLPRGWVSH